MPKKLRMQIKPLPNSMFRIQIFVDPHLTGFDSPGIVQIVPDSMM